MSVEEVGAFPGVVLPLFFGFLGIMAFEKLGMLDDIDPAFATLIAITAGAMLTATSTGIQTSRGHRE